jgi:hypothetical protein
MATDKFGRLGLRYHLLWHVLQTVPHNGQQLGTVSPATR